MSIGIVRLGLGVWLAGSVGMAAASPSGVVISQFRVDGPSGGNDEFVELYNAGTASVDIGGWQLQGCSSGAGTSSTRATVMAGVSLAAGAHYLFTNSASSGYSGSVAGDQTYATRFSNSGKSGIQIVNGVAAKQDGVGLAGSVCAEGAALTSIAGASGNFAWQRGSNGAQDSDANTADFSGPSGLGAPRNLGGGGGPVACANVGLRIYALQSAAHVSPYRGQCTSQVPGVVTQRVSDGFYLQDPQGDGNDATSDGIYVFTGSAPAAEIVVGAQVLVDGTVNEYRPGSSFGATNCPSSSGACNLSTTEIDAPTVTLASGLFANPVVTPVIIGNGGRAISTQIIDNDSSGSLEVAAQTQYGPAEDGIDFFESLEGMQVRVNQARVVSPTTSFGEIWVLADGGAFATSSNARGGITLVERAAGIDFNPERIQVDVSPLGTPYVQANVGDSAASVSGALGYNFGNFRVFPASRPSFVTAGLQRTVSQVSSGADRLRIASYNVENLDPNDSDSCDGGADRDIADGRFAAEAQQIVQALGSPDVLALEELQDNSGCTDDGTVSAELTVQTLVDAIVAAGGPRYAYSLISPQNNADGGAPGANIRVGLLYDASRVQLLAGTTGNGDTLTATAPVIGSDGKLALSLSPGRVAPNDAAWSNSRKPLAAVFEFNGERVLVIVNHFNSKGGDMPLFGRFQPPILGSETQRLQQAQTLHDFIAQALTLDSSARVVALGDFNDFDWSAPMRRLTGADSGNVLLHDLATALLPAEERYSYVYQGNSQELDHIYVSSALTEAAEVQAVHVNAEYADQISDHDPIIASLRIGVADTSPDAFELGSVSNAEPGSVQTSNSITVSGISAAVPVAVQGGRYSLNGGSYTTQPGSAQAGDVISVQLDASTAFSGNALATLTLGNVSGEFHVSTRAADTQPDAFVFAPVIGAALNTTLLSEPVTISGIEAPAAISVQGGRFCLNDAPCTDMLGAAARAGDRLRLQVQSAPLPGSSTSATVEVGGVSGTFTVTTEPCVAGTLGFDSVAVATVQEGDQLTLTVTRTGGSCGAASLNWAVLPGTASWLDLTAPYSGTLRWAAGEGGSKRITLRARIDLRLLEGRESFKVALFGAQAAELDAARANRTVTIVPRRLLGH